MPNRDLFVSHSSIDAEIAQTLVGEFEARGISCWVAPRDIPVGGSYQAEIVDAIDGCKAVLLVFSAATNTSEHVLREVELAVQGKKPILPIRIDGALPSGGLKYVLTNKQWIERKGGNAAAIEAIERTLKGGAAPATSMPASPPVAAAARTPAPGARSGRTALVAAVAAILVLSAGATGGWLLLRDRTVPPPRVAEADPPKPAALPPEPAKAPEPIAVPPQSPPLTQSGTAPTTPVPPQAPAQAPTEKQTAVAPRPGGTVVIRAGAPEDPRALKEGVHLFQECSECPVMAVVPAGKATVGSPTHELGRGPDEGPLQQVVITTPFAIARSEVSFDEWLACVAGGGCNAYRPGDYGWGYGKQPVINVSWNDAKAYVEWLSRKTGAPYRLPSEAEWEYAARGCLSAGCASLPFWFGKQITPERANYDWRFSYDGSPKAQALRRTVAVTTSEANPFGLHHMHGNVREWVEDCWNQSLAGVPANGAPRLTGDCQTRVVRGGAWSDEPKDVRSAKRSWETVGERRAQIGFRVARSFNP